MIRISRSDFPLHNAGNRIAKRMYIKHTQRGNECSCPYMTQT